MIRLEPGDCLDVIPRLVAEGVVVDAVVCDPPYNLSEIVPHRSPDFMSPRTEADRASRKGFMGMSWDGTRIAFKPETWATIGTIMRPGAFLLAFGGTRTFHRMACAIEDAGFIIQDSILSLISTDAHMQRFVATLNEAQTEAFSDILDQMQHGGVGAWTYGSGFPKRKDMLKPAWEPIIMAYKPAGKRSLAVDECRIVTKDKRTGWDGSARRKPMEGDQRKGSALGMFNPSGKRTLHVDECRIRTDETITTHSRSGDAKVLFGWNKQQPTNQNPGQELGRWPANVCHDGSDEVMEAFAAFGESAASSGPFYRRTTLGVESNVNIASRKNELAGVGHGDTGSVARFFYCAKADKQDRWGSKHPTVKPVELMKWLVQLVTPKGGLVLDCFAGSGTTGVAALATGRNAILIEREAEYQNDIRERIAHYEGEGRHSLAVKNRSRSAQVGTLI